MHSIHQQSNSEVALSISHVSIEKENPVSLGMKHLQLHVPPNGIFRPCVRLVWEVFPMLEIVTGPVGYIFKLSRGPERPYSEQSEDCN